MKKLLLSLLLILSLATGGYAQMGAPPPMAGGKLIDPVTAPSNGQVLKYNSTTGLWSPAADNTGAGGTITFDAVESGSNTTATMTVGTGGSLAYTGSGVIDASKILGVTPVANALTLLGHDFANMRTDLGLVIGTNVQAYDADLDYLSTFTPTANVKSILNAANYAAIRTLMDLGTTTGARLDYLGSAGGTTGTTSTNIVFSTSPTLVTPTLGAATATSINKVALTAPASGSTLTIADGKTLTVSKTMQLTSADDTTVATFPAGAVTVGVTGTLTNTKWCRTDGTSIICDQDAPTGSGTITKVGDITTGEAFSTGTPGKTLIFNNATSGSITLQAVTGALGTVTVSLPAATGTIQVSPTTTTANKVFLGTTTAGLGAWSTATYPATTTANQLLYSSATNTVGGLTSGNSSVLVTDGSGVPSLATDIPTAVTIGSAYVYRAGGTDVPVTDGGTGRSTGTTAYALVATGTTATGAQQSLAAGATTEILVGGGASALPVWTTATGTGAPVRAGSPTFTTKITTPLVDLGAVGATAGQIVVYNATSGSITINPATGALGSTVYTLPATTGTVALGTGTANYAAYWSATNTLAGEAYLLTSRGGTGLGSYTAGDMVYYATGTALSKLAIGSAGTLIRSSGTAPAWSTTTMPDTIALGSVFAANSANTLSAITSTSGTKFLQNADGVISWQTGVGTISGSTGSTDNRLIRADGTGGVTIQSSAITVDDSGNMSGVGTFSAGAAGFTVDADGDVTAKSVTLSKATGVAGDLGLYEANSTDTDAAGFRGPSTISANNSYRGQFPAAKPSVANSVLAWDGSTSTGTGTPADPYIQSMSFIVPLQLTGGTMTGKLITSTPASPGTAGLNLPHGAAPGTLADGDLWTTTGGLYARINGSTVGPYISAGSLIDDTAYDATSWNGVTAVGPSKNAVRDYLETIAPSSIVAGAYGGTGVANTGKTITIGGNVVFSGAYAMQFTVPGAYTYTLPSATKTLAASDASNLAVGSDARGDILYRGASVYGRLPIGTNNQILTTNGTDPSWSIYGLSGTSGQTYTFPSTSKTLAASDGSNLAFGSDAQGDIAVRGASTYGRLALGTQYKVLMAGASTLAYSDYTFPATLTTNGVVYASSATALETTTTPTITGTNITGVPISTGVSGLGSNVATFLGTPSSANLASAITDETGSGLLVFATSPSLTTPVLGAATATSVLATGIVDGTAPIVITTTSADYQVGATYKSGYTFINPTSSSASNSAVLPAAAEGCQYCIGNYAAKTGTLTVKTKTGSGAQYIDLDGVLTANTGNVHATAAAGNFACFVGVSSSVWKAIPTKGTWSKD